VTHLAVVPASSTRLNSSSPPPDSLWLYLPRGAQTAVNKTYSYVFKGEVVDTEVGQIEQKVCCLARIA